MPPALVDVPGVFVVAPGIGVVAAGLVAAVPRRTVRFLVFRRERMRLSSPKRDRNTETIKPLRGAPPCA